MATPASAAASGTRTLTGSMNAARAGGRATLLPDGDVLATSGFGIGTENGGPFAEPYTPATGQWSPAINGLPSLYACSGVLACFGSSATLLGDGNVLIAGGESFAKHAPTGLVSAELYTP